MENSLKFNGGQLELFERSATDAMSMDEFATWLSEYSGSGISEVLQIAAFMLCCDVISQDIGKSTLRLRERIDSSRSTIVHPENHPIAGLLALEPNDRHTWYEFSEMMIYWGCLTSNSYAGIIRNSHGDPLEVIPFQSSRVMQKVNGRDIFYDVHAATQQEAALLGNYSASFPERNMIHVRGRMINGMDGYSTITAGDTTLKTGKLINRFRSQLFNEEGLTRGVFTREKEGSLDEQAFQRLRDQFRILMNKFHKSVEPIVLEDGIKFQAISSNPAEIELSKQFEAQINDICRLLRVPPHKVFLMSGTKYENLETLEKAYVGDTLIPIAKRFEQRYSKALLSRDDRLRYFFEYDRTEMTLRDTKLETERVIRAVERGVITFDEARAELGWNQLPGVSGSARMIPSNMIVVDENNTVLISASTVSEDAKQSDQTEDDNPDKVKSIEPALRLVN